MIGGTLIRGGAAAAGLGRITSAGGEKHEGGDREELDDKCFHVWDSCLVG
jgi:hypothetical protein